MNETPASKAHLEISKPLVRTGDNRRPSNARNSPEKPKRFDTTFAQFTEAAVGDIDTSTVPVSRSTISSISTQSLRPRISSISSEVITEKRAKYLSEPVGSSSPPSVNAEWSNLKTVGEVPHNNVTLGKSHAQDETIKSVNGKIDHSEDEVTENVFSETSATERNVDDQETQLQKSNSSRIVDVQDDNSISAIQSSSNNSTSLHRPTIQMTSHRAFEVIKKDDKEPGTIKKDAILESTESMLETDRPKTNQSSERPIDASSSTEIATDKEIYSTTEEELTTTIEVDETTSVETTTLHGVSRPIKVKEDLVEETTVVPTTESAEDLTTVVTTQKEEPTSQSVIPKATADNVSETPSNVSKTTNKISKSANNGTESAIKVNPEASNVSQAVSESVEAATPQANSSSTPIMTTQAMTNPTNAVTKQRIILPTENASKPLLTSTTRPVNPQTKISITETTEAANDSVTAKADLSNTSEAVLPKRPETRATPPIEHQTEIAQVRDGEPTDVNAMIAIGISVIAVITLILLVAFLLVMRKRQKQLTYGQRCRPIGLDAYSLDNISVYNSVRRKSAIRASKRAFGNAGFDDPGLKPNPLNISQLATYSQKRVSINDEFRDIPTVTARIEEVPIGCEDKNR